MNKLFIVIKLYKKLNGFHLQKYEMIKTEDIPHLENSTFSTRVVKDIAQNILSFLKSNCTKEGHTYWLFKGENLKALFSGSIMLFGGLVYVNGYISCYCVNPQLVGVTL